MMASIQKEAFPLAGLMYANVNVWSKAARRQIATNSDVWNLSKPDICHRQIFTNLGVFGTSTHAHECEAGITAPANASPSFSRRGDEESFETSTRTGLFAPVRTREEGFSDITTRGGNHSTGVSFRRSTRVREGKFSESIKKGSTYRSDHQRGNQCYSPNVAAKSVTGIGTPNTLRATQTPKASFFVSIHYAHQISGLARTVSMVALVGLRSRRPVSFVSGSSNPANVTAKYKIGTLGGDSLNTKEAAAMLATTHTQNPQFIWLIAAVRRDTPTITAKIHHIAAETEKEARRSLAQDHVCFFAGRIRLEVAA